MATHASIKRVVNENYWDAEDGIYYDIHAETGAFLKTKTPASFWPMLAEMCDRDQASRMVKHLQDPNVFGGDRPWPSVSRDDPAFVPRHGDYWQGGIWLPLAYMGTKALEKYGYHRDAADAADRLLTQMLNTYRDDELNADRDHIDRGYL